MTHWLLFLLLANSWHSIIPWTDPWQYTSKDVCESAYTDLKKHYEELRLGPPKHYCVPYIHARQS